MLGFIQRNLNGSPSRFKELVYLTLVRSGFEYAYVAWNQLRQREMDRLKKIQRRAIGAYALSPIITAGNVDSLFDSLGLDSLQERRKTARLCML